MFVGLFGSDSETGIWGRVPAWKLGLPQEVAGAAIGHGPYCPYIFRCLTSEVDGRAYLTDAGPDPGREKRPV